MESNSQLQTPPQVKLTVIAVVANLFWIVRFVAHVAYQGGLPFKHWPNFRGESPKVRFHLLSSRLDHISPT